MTHFIHKGGCQCGAVRYQTTATPKRAMACHCTTCKLRTGSPYGVGVYFAEAEVEFTKGKMNTFEFHSDTSNRWIRNHFCEKCGSVVSWTLEMRPGLRSIAGGSFDEPGWYKIEAHIWTRSARSDMRYPEGMEIFEEALTG